MEIKFGLFSCDSHAQLDQDAWTKRMSKAQWGDRIPQIVELEEGGQLLDRWMVNGRVRDGWVCNCPAAMEGGVERGYYPKRWQEVPRIVFDPAERLKALDHDRVDGEVLFPNTPVPNFGFFQSDAAFELACVQAHNDALAEWREVSDRYVPLAVSRAESDEERTAPNERSLLGSVMGLLPELECSDSLARLGRSSRTAFIA
jgi:hypothetical protein